MKDEYFPRTIEQRLGYLIEECGEVLHAAGKTLRYGLMSFNPELPANEQVTNLSWLLSEMKDLERAIALLREKL